MKDNLIDEILIFYLFKETDNQIKLIKLLKDISDFYSDWKNNEKLENLKLSLKNLINNLNDNSLKTKNKKKQILFTKTKEDKQYIWVFLNKFYLIFYIFFIFSE